MTVNFHYIVESAFISYLWTIDKNHYANLFMLLAEMKYSALCELDWIEAHFVKWITRFRGNGNWRNTPSYISAAIEAIATPQHARNALKIFISTQVMGNCFKNWNLIIFIIPQFSLLAFLGSPTIPCHQQRGQK